MADIIIKHKYSDEPGTAPSSLAEGEIAINRADKKLYISTADDEIVAIAVEPPFEADPNGGG